ncbi:hypothetical protein FA95DRAFT_1595353 [Auriscalpium vulgare]|uniref:Uncharacterized protein n=1 Tax=Auriscalpium vulgare TaxID=40419 RepID=A0ACB8RVU2_9AGAM|nr:hypothetical protein FA95DRAFT_1595353 [Auriscalpium vulgare]
MNDYTQFNFQHAGYDDTTPPDAMNQGYFHPFYDPSQYQPQPLPYGFPQAPYGFPPAPYNYNPHHGNGDYLTSTQPAEVIPAQAYCDGSRQNPAPYQPPSWGPAPTSTYDQGGARAVTFASFAPQWQPLGVPPHPYAYGHAQTDAYPVQSGLGAQTNAYQPSVYAHASAAAAAAPAAAPVPVHAPQLVSLLPPPQAQSQAAMTPIPSTTLAQRIRRQRRPQEGHLGAMVQATGTNMRVFSQYEDGAPPLQGYSMMPPPSQTGAGAASGSSNGGPVRRRREKTRSSPIPTASQPTSTNTSGATMKSEFELMTKDLGQDAEPLVRKHRCARCKQGTNKPIKPQHMPKHLFSKTHIRVLPRPLQEVVPIYVCAMFPECTNVGSRQDRAKTHQVKCPMYKDAHGTASVNAPSMNLLELARKLFQAGKIDCNPDADELKGENLADMVWKAPRAAQTTASRPSSPSEIGAASSSGSSSSPASTSDVSIFDISRNPSPSTAKSSPALPAPQAAAADALSCVAHTPPAVAAHLLPTPARVADVLGDAIDGAPVYAAKHPDEVDWLDPALSSASFSAPISYGFPSDAEKYAAANEFVLSQWAAARANDSTS